MHDTLFPLYESLSKFIFKFCPLKLKMVRKNFSNTMTKHNHRQRAFQFACTSDAQSLFLKMRNYAQSIVVASRLIKQQLLLANIIYRCSLFSINAMGIFTNLEHIKILVEERKNRLNRTIFKTYRWKLLIEFSAKSRLPFLISRSISNSISISIGLIKFLFLLVFASFRVPFCIQMI